jgi:hypothetical protein
VASSDVVQRRRFGVPAERGLEIGVVGEVLGRVEGNGSPLESARLDEMFGARAFIGAECGDQIPIGSDVRQSVEGGGAPSNLPASM